MPCTELYSDEFIENLENKANKIQQEFDDFKDSFFQCESCNYFYPRIPENGDVMCLGPDTCIKCGKQICYSCNIPCDGNSYCRQCDSDMTTDVQSEGFGPGPLDTPFMCGSL